MIGGMTENTRPPDEPTTGYPLRRWLVAALVALLLVQLGGVIRLLQWPDAPAALSPPVQIGVYAVWTGLMAWATSAAWRGRPRFGLIVLLAYVVYMAAQLVIFTRADYERGRLPFLLAGLGVVMVGLIAALIVELRRNAKKRD